jgi:murein DD-endopeptidase MepM/ murein hydrolase activator NlpD
MKIIILSTPYKPFVEIDINSTLIFKVSLIPLVFVGLTIFFDWNINPFNKDNEISSLELANYQMEQKLSELQKQLDTSSKRVEILAQQQDYTNQNLDLAPQTAMLASRQDNDNKKGGPLTLSNKILNLDSTQVQIDRLLSQAYQFDYQLSAIEKSTNQSPRENQSIPSGSPLQDIYQVSSPYGYRMDPFTNVSSLHEGVDLSAEVNSRIFATADGVVTQSGQVGGFGLLIEIKHDNGLMTRYGHANKLLVQVGDSVKKGQLIGLVGNTGRSTGNHLHYEVLIGGQSIDPQKLMKNN